MQFKLHSPVKTHNAPPSTHTRRCVCVCAGKPQCTHADEKRRA